KSDKKTFIDCWVDKNNKKEFCDLFRIYTDHSYFNKLYSDYRTKKIIDFSNENKIKFITLSAIITLITLFASIFPNINDMKFFWYKIGLSILPIIFEVLLYVFAYKRKRKNKIYTLQEKICYVSSAVAKTLHENNI
ncbi:MAG: hypothetical protein J5781_00915, partial [Clostridia bacterium]|nr:hypothetical protein [Clostridia bacterium]